MRSTSTPSAPPSSRRGACYTVFVHGERFSHVAGFRPRRGSGPCGRLPARPAWHRRDEPALVLARERKRGNVGRRPATRSAWITSTIPIQVSTFQAQSNRTPPTLGNLKGIWMVMRGERTPIPWKHWPRSAHRCDHMASLAAGPTRVLQGIGVTHHHYPDPVYV
jgi:hypothetical protein